jgi:hypothetical protein
MTDGARVFGSVLPREHTVADKALAHVLTNDYKHFPNLVNAPAARVSRCYVVSSHVDQQLSHKGMLADQPKTKKSAVTAKGLRPPRKNPF